MDSDLTKTPPPQKSLTKSDLAIIDVLREDSRSTVADLAKRTGRSRAYISERIHSLVKSERLKFSILVKASAVGLHLPVFLEIAVSPQNMESVGVTLSEYDEIFVVYQMTGKSALHVHAFLADTDHMARFLKDKIYPIEGVRSVNTSLLIKKYKYQLDLY